jgi:hypothetical protein
MDHSYIEEQNIVARYEMGKLSSADRERFEEHLVDCPECQELLTVTEDFRSGLRTVTAEEATQSRHLAGDFSNRWLSVSLGRRPALVALAALVLLSALPGALLIKHVRGLRSQLNQARQQYTEERQARAEMERRLNNLEQGAQRGGNMFPAIASVFPLAAVRGDYSPGSEPVNQLTIPRIPQLIVLSLDIRDDPQSRTYKATLSEAGGKVLWVQSSLIPAGNTLAIALPQQMFSQNDYLLNVEGSASDGRVVVRHTYPMRIGFSR